MEDDRTQRVYLFDGTNFSNWSFRMESYLEELGLLHCIEKTLEEEDFFPVVPEDTAAVKKEKEDKRARRKQEDAKCKSILIHKIADSQLEYIRGKTSPRAIWTTLQHTFERKGVSGVFYLLKQLAGMKYDERRPMEEHILAFEKTIRELESAEIKFDKPVVVFFLLQSMPKSYDQLITVLETLPVEQCSMEFVKSRLLSEDAKRQHNGDRPETSTAFAGRSGKFVFKCHSCGKPGHKRANCPENPKNERPVAKPEKQKKKSKAHVAESGSDVAFMTVDGEPAGGEFRWILDSGASEHMVSDKNYLQNVRTLDSPIVINVAKSGVSLTSRVAGEVKMTSNVEGGQLTCTVYNVLYVPGLYANLFSVKRVTERGMEVTFGKDGARITRGSEVVCTASRKGRLYELDVDVPKIESAMAADQGSKLTLWHRRYGHIGNAGLVKLIRNGMVEGIDVGSGSLKPDGGVCEPCMMGKQTRQPFDEAVQPRSSRPLELIHTDVCGPFTPASWDGQKVFVSFIDDFTHFTAVYVLKSKGDVLDAFRKYAAMATVHFGTRIARLRSDNGGEYINANFVQFCEEAGIVMEPTVPYTPQQNGVAERMNRTIMERARSMLDDAGFKRSMWNEAVLTAVHLINRSPTTALAENRTPYEMWFGHKPNVSRLRVFGSKAFCHVPKEKRTKLDAKSQVCYLVGYGVNGYRVWDPVRRKITIARDVVVEESESKRRVEVHTNDHLVSDRLEPLEERPNLRREANPEPNSEPAIEETEDGAAGGCDSSADEFGSAEDDEVPVRRSDRLRRPPARFSDFDVCMAFALNAENYVEALPDDINELRKRDDWPEWKRAIDDEMHALEKNRTWDLVDLPTGVRPVPCKWVFKIKYGDDGSIDRYKARLVAKGCSQRQGYDYQETYAPVVRMTTVRTLLAVAVQKNLHLHQMDVRTAFLNGNLTETVYMRQPPGFERGNKVCRLNKSLYGLKQAPRSWNERFNSFILKLGFQRSQYDSCLYTRKANGVWTYLVLYVDDIVLASSSLEEIERIKRKMKSEFEMDDMQELKNFLGMRIQYNMEEGTLRLNQAKYISALLKRFGMDNCKPAMTPLDANQKLTRKKDNEEATQHPYRELIGCLTYLMLSTRPDISIAVNFLSRFQSGATDEHWCHLKRVLRYLQGTKHLCLEYRRNTDADPLVGFADADWGSDMDDRRSTSGYVFQVYGSTVSWTTRKQATISLSSTEAEYVSLSQASCEAIWLRNLLTEFGVNLDVPLVIHEDNQSCIHIAEEPRDQKRMKHLDIRYNFIRECIQNDVIKLQYIPTEDQLADVFTKGLPGPAFLKHRSTLGLRGGVRNKH